MSIAWEFPACHCGARVTAEVPMPSGRYETVGADCPGCGRRWALMFRDAFLIGSVEWTDGGRENYDRLLRNAAAGEGRRLHPNDPERQAIHAAAWRAGHEFRGRRPWLRWIPRPARGWIFRRFGLTPRLREAAAAHGIKFRSG